MSNGFMYQFGPSIILCHHQDYAVYHLGVTPQNAAILYTISGVMVLFFKLLVYNLEFTIAFIITELVYIFV